MGIYFLLAGKLRYNSSSCENQVGDTSVMLEKGAVMCEAALFTDWVHQGSMVAVGHAEVAAVSAKNFVSVVKRHPRACQISAEYGSVFLQLIAETPPGEVNDLRVGKGFETLVDKVANPVVRQLLRGHNAAPKSLANSPPLKPDMFGAECGA